MFQVGDEVTSLDHRDEPGQRFTVLETGIRHISGPCSKLAGGFYRLDMNLVPAPAAWSALDVVKAEALAELNEILDGMGEEPTTPAELVMAGIRLVPIDEVRV